MRTVFDPQMTFGQNFSKPEALPRKFYAFASVDVLKL